MIRKRLKLEQLLEAIAADGFVTASGEGWEALRAARGEAG